MDVRDFTVAVVGSGGDGAVTCGEMLTHAAAGEGLYCFMSKSFGPQIRGGESFSQIRMSEDMVLSQGDRVDALVVFSWPDFLRFKDEIELKPGAIVIHDETKNKDFPDGLPINEFLEPRIIHVPFTDLAEEAAGNSLAKNMVMLGAISEFFNLPVEGLKQSIAKKYKKKSAKIVESNCAAVEAGRKYVRDNHEVESMPRLSYEKSDTKMVMNGNEAVAYGALYAGCRFFAGYPITPSSEIMEWLSRELPRFGGVEVQTEDEMAAINMVIGASFAGAKAMTCTSGPGLSLMQEAIGLAAIAEIPCVIIDVQRVGPSTGIPTKSEQSDLLAALHGSHGDVSKVVLAAADVEDCFDVTCLAFYISEKYQVPVIVLSDQFIGQRMEAVPRIDLSKRKSFERIKPSIQEGEKYERFKIDNGGVSPMAVPGMEHCEYLASGIEHTESGSPTSAHSIHEMMNKKRFHKLDDIREDLTFVRRYGPEDAEVGVIGWGSSKGAIKEAILRAEKLGMKVAGLVPQIIHPIPYDKIDEFMKPLRRILVVEVSYAGQFYNYLKSYYPVPDKLMLYKRSGSKSLTVEEVFQQICHAMQSEYVL